jgi:hypothetical protein
MSDTGRIGWVGIDRHWLSDPSLSDSDLRLMLWLTSHTEEFRSRLHVKACAEQIGWSRDRVKRALVSLEALDEAPTNSTSTVEESTEEIASDVSDVEVNGPEHELCGLFAEQLRERGYKPVVTPAWIRDMERMIRLDGREPAAVAKVLRWLHEGEGKTAQFWRPNIQSPATLRGQWVRMSEQYAVERRASGGPKLSQAEQAIENIRNGIRS